MRNAILGWYAYSESGAAGTREHKRLSAFTARPDRWPTRRTEFGGSAADEFGAPEGGLTPPVRSVPPAADPTDPTAVAELFADVRQLDAAVDARGWWDLFSRFGLDGLIDLAKRRGGWPTPTADEVIAQAVVREALDAGYDPVSGLTGAVRRETGRFEPAGGRGDRGRRDGQEV